MTWADWLIVSVTLHYVVAAVIYLWAGQIWLAWTYAAYGLANVGLIGLSMAVQR